MPGFHLFHIKVHRMRTFQYDLTVPMVPLPKTPQGVLKELILDRPCSEPRRGVVWRIGNVQELDDLGGVYFRLGRTTRKKHWVYEGGEFVDRELEDAPYTHVVMDIQMEVCAIAKQPVLAPKPEGISKQFMRLLSDAAKKKNFPVTFEVDDIKDPNTFVKHVREAYRVRRFGFNFSPPNPWDDGDDWIGPMERWASAINGESGKAEVSGEDLDRDVIAAVSHVVAAAGKDAWAKLQIEEGVKLETKKLKDNPAVVSVEDVSDTKGKRALLDLVRSEYMRIREPDDQS